MIKSINQVYSIIRPSLADTRLPIVIDSPHSGTDYPFNSGIIAPSEALRTTWDAFVDELWSIAPPLGAPLLSARFPRAYIDPNRAPEDIDQAMLDEPWPTPLTPSAACLRGMGLIRLNALPGVPMYAGKVSAAEVRYRLSQYYMPYHSALKTLLDDAHEKFGHVWHINCHSMKSVGNAMNVDSGVARPDIVISDRNGTSANPAFTEWAAAQFDALGYKVQINSPYQGGHIVHHYGMPTQHRHSVQIEIKRGVYMDERNAEKAEGFEQLQRDLETFVTALAGYAQQKMKEK
ncbi:N-formylglutamate amidohydrolase [Herbaspirillum lusitanum]|uniref:N-formylglutamate amidohydrolase n=1 Tax=Herbaspirillum lusitanum TaxID=213312 RepID=A0ABW9AAW3_9BURK